MSHKFEFYEIVRINEFHDHLEDVTGLEGVVLGINQNEDGMWYYGVSLHKLNEVWMFSEKSLETTGKKSKREDLYDGTSISVSVNSQTGEGKISRF